MDGIVGLVIAAIVKQLAPADTMTSFNWATIAQPVLVSLAVIIIPIPLVRYILAPCYTRLLMHVPDGYVQLWNSIIIIGILSALTEIISYAGVSMLLDAFIVGKILAYLDNQTSSSSNQASISAAFSISIISLQTILLEPLFYASIGYAIPSASLVNATIA